MILCTRPHRVPRLTAASSSDQSCLFPSNAEPTIDDGVALWELLLQFISQREAEFDYWFELIKARYFVVFFPQICQELGLKVDHCTPASRTNAAHFAYRLISQSTQAPPSRSFSRVALIAAHTARGFSNCPHPLLRSLINQIAVWAENPAICQILWAPKNGLLMMEFLRQSSMMGIKDYHATIKRANDTFRLFLMVRAHSER